MPQRRNRAGLLSLLGYDPQVYRAMSVRHYHTLRTLCGAWLFICILLGVAAGYGGWLIAPSYVFAVSLGIGTTVLVLNLLRVVHAGGGASLEAKSHEYTPSAVPPVVLVVLAALLAQPAHIGFADDLDPAVDTYRAQLLTAHERAAQDLGVSGDYIREEIQTAEFPIFRLQILWRDWQAALWWTLVFCFVIASPALWARFFALGALRCYQDTRNQLWHRRVDRIRRSTKECVDNALAYWPSYDNHRPGATR